MKMNKTTIALLVFFMLLCTVFLGYYYFEIMKHPRPLKTYGNPGHKVRDFSLTNQDGKTITAKDMEGKIYVVDFIFTTCEGICPRMSDNMVAVYQAYRNDPEIMILSHTVDPKKDTVEQIKRYSLKYDADPNKWMFLTGAKSELYSMALDGYLISVADSTVEEVNPTFIHSPYFILVDKEKAVRGFYDGTDKGKVNKLIEDIKELKKEYQKKN